MVENGDFTPAQVAKLSQLENVLERESEIREYRAFTGGEDRIMEFHNPSFRTSPTKDEPHMYTIVFDRALLRGMLKVKLALREDIVRDEIGQVDPAKHGVVEGLLDSHRKRE